MFHSKSAYHQNHDFTTMSLSLLSFYHEYEICTFTTFNLNSFYKLDIVTILLEITKFV